MPTSSASDPLRAAVELLVEHAGRDLVDLVAAVEGHERRLRADGRRLPAGLVWLQAAARARVLSRPEPSSSPDGGEVADDAPVPAPSLLLSIPEVATFELGVSESTVERLIREGQLPAVKVGRLTKVRRSDLEAYVAELPVDRRASA